ncbi:MAG: ABC transporter substrate-binding protein [Dermabacter sp.]|nr:ABC transporter substrate-binding protein [Dermabacter sp.]
MGTPRTLSRRAALKAGAVTASAAGLVAAISACAPSGTSGGSGAASDEGGDHEVKADGTIKAAISYELGTNGYDPMTTTAALTVAVNWHTLEGLTELYPASREVYAALASEIPSTDGTSVDVALRDGAVFHDGTKVTPEDVVFSFERVLNPDNNSLYAQFIPFIDSVVANGEDGVTINLKHPTGLLAERLSVVKIVPKAAVEADPTAFDANPVGTGPWKMTDNGAASKVITFERFDDYTGEVPARAKTMEWQVIPDASTRTNSIQSGEVQAIDSVPYLSIDALKGTSTVESVQGFGLLFAMFNNSANNPFSDLRNRQAFLTGVDTERVITTGLSGQAQPVTCFVQEDHPAYKKASTVYTHDVAKAKAAFAETGLTKFRMLCTDHDWVQQVTPIIQESLQEAGVTVEIEQKQSAEVYTTIDSNPDAFDVVIAPGDPSVFGQDADLLMRWWYAGDVWIDNRMHWKGSEAQVSLQELLTAGIEATDTKDQMDAWHKSFDLISDEVPLYPLFHRKTPTAYNGQSLVDFQPISLTGLSFVGVASGI